MIQLIAIFDLALCAFVHIPTQWHLKSVYRTLSRHNELALTSV